MLLAVTRLRAGFRLRAAEQPGRPDAEGRLGWLLALAGAAAAIAAAVASPPAALAAARQDWPPFVLVAGLLLTGLVADGDGLFAAAGHRLARAVGSGTMLFAGAAVLVGLVTATLNLDTSVAFLTPVLVYTARSRGAGEAPLLYGCLLLSNAGSLLLPGSNLTNLIVLSHLQLSGAQFAGRMWLPWAAALASTAAVVAVAERGALRARPGDVTPADRPVLGVGLAARTPPRPFALLVGLNLGPNLFVTGSLAWILWLRAARGTGARPSVGRAPRLGAVAVPASMAAALAGLILTGSR